MARPLEFDRDQALMSALGVFWRQGYQAASVPDLLEATGLSRSSLYAAFGDKRGLYLQCLDLYTARTLGLLAQTRAEHPPLVALRVFFERTLLQPGCLLVNTTLEMAEVDDGLRDEAGVRMAQVQEAFEVCLRDAGCTPSQAAELAGFLMLINQGLRVSSRRDLTPETRQAQLDTAFKILAAAIPQAALRPPEPEPSHEA
ncbi:MULTISPECIES: TetR/AcrR family transcriptional regulator [Phenylobacterium]|jgi:TetR/AcrR family transcriptional repressor of nem operon|uniref:TetR/AcrR family transcriptional regulator n=1 Tax=Phenylobacterium conjunctum TaxID=1298959 RepID=A0ABW3T104_9CAUL